MIVIIVSEQRSKMSDLISSVRANNLEGVNNCLVRGDDVNTKDVDDWTALMVACNAGHSGIVSRLVVEEELDINYQGGDGYTAALLATEDGETECVRVLAGTGKVDWNLGDKMGWTPLYWALHQGHCDIVDILLEIPGLNLNVKTVDGETLAHAAARGGVRIVETLASQEKFDCWNVPDKYGDTPVVKALKWDTIDSVKVLVDCPLVDLTIRDKDGWTLAMRTIAWEMLGGEMLGGEVLGEC